MKQPNKVIGRTTVIDVDSITNIPAKVDTGADSSSIWASDIKLENSELSFFLFDKTSPYYSGDRIMVSPSDYSVIKVASSSGERQVRYVVTLAAVLEGQPFKIRFTLSDRSTMLYPVLLGHHFLGSRFLVDTTSNLPEKVQAELMQEKRNRLQVIIDQNKPAAERRLT
jgi:hypothetical protein